eukprot:5147605-Amphidinium_carterae.1
MQSTEAFGNTTEVLLSMWRFPSFVASRWLTLGCACRSLWLGIMIGYPHLYAHLRSEGLLGDHEGAAGDHFLDANFANTLLMSLVACVPASMMSDLISDNRLPQQSEALQDQLSEDVTYLLSLPSSR